MTTPATMWTSDELAAIETTDELRLAPRRQPGHRHHQGAAAIVPSERS